MTVISLHHARVRLHVRLEDEARVAFIDRDFHRALRQGAASVRFLPGCAGAHVLVGDILCALGREAEALRAYHHARRLAPRAAEPYWSISTVHSLAGRFECAMRYLELAKARLRRGDGPLYEWTAEDRALALSQLGRNAEALEAVRWGLRHNPKAARLLEMRAELRSARRPRPRLRSVPSLSRRPLRD